MLCLTLAQKTEFEFSTPLYVTGNKLPAAA